MLAYLKQSVRRHLSGNPISNKERFLIISKIQNGEYINWASETSYIKDHSEIMYAAIRVNGMILNFASSRLQKDPCLVLMAAKQNISSIQYASHELMDDEDFINRCILEDLDVLNFASPRIQTIEQSRESLIQQSIKQNIKSLKESPLELRSSKKWVQAILAINGDELEFASETLQNDLNTVLIALRNRASAYKFINQDLRLVPLIAKWTRHADTFVSIEDENLQNKDFYMEKLYNLSRVDKVTKSFDTRERLWKICKYLMSYLTEIESSFIVNNYQYISEQDWPIIKEALIKQPEIMSTPPIVITSLLEGTNNKLVTLAQYALAKTWKIDETIALPDDLLC